MLNLDDKPRTLSLKDFLIKRISVKMRTSENTVSSVINHQFSALVKALPNVNSAEIAGFGKFLFNKGRAIKMVDKLKRDLDDHLTKGTRLKYGKTADQMKEEINQIERKIHGTEPQTNSGRVEEHHLQEGSSRTNSPEEVSHM